MVDRKTSRVFCRYWGCQLGGRFEFFGMGRLLSLDWLHGSASCKVQDSGEGIAARQVKEGGLSSVWSGVVDSRQAMACLSQSTRACRAVVNVRVGADHSDGG